MENHHISQVNQIQPSHSLELNGNVLTTPGRRLLSLRIVKKAYGPT